MTLTPELALAYLRELSTDYRAGVILGPQSAILAGDERLARAAQEFLRLGEAAAPGAPTGSEAGEVEPAAGAGGAGGEAAGAGPIEIHEGAAEGGKVFLAKAGGLVIVVTTGPFALGRVARHDLVTVLAGMGAESAQGTSVQRIPHGSVEALVNVSG